MKHLLWFFPTFKVQFKYSFFSFFKLEQHKFIFSLFWSWNIEIRVPTFSGFGKSSLLGLQTSSCHVLTWQKERELSVASSKDTNLMPVQILFLPWSLPEDQFLVAFFSGCTHVCLRGVNFFFAAFFFHSANYKDIWQAACRVLVIRGCACVSVPLSSPLRAGTEMDSSQLSFSTLH